MKKEHLKLHLKDGIRSLREQPADIAQAEHNFFEIANHLGIMNTEIVDAKNEKSFAVTFSYTINVIAVDWNEAEAEAMKRWDEDAPRTDEMNAKVEPLD